MITTTSSNRLQPEQILASLRHELDEQRLAREIDRPLQAVLHSFSASVSSPTTRHALHNQLGRFVQASHRVVGLPLDASLATDYAVTLLQQQDSAPHAAGYEVAIMSALTAPDDGLAELLHGLCSQLTRLFRAKRIDACLDQRLRPLPLDEKVDLVRHIITRNTSQLPEALAKSPPSLLIPLLSELLKTELLVDNTIHQQLL